MNVLILQIIVNKLEDIVKNKIGLNVLNQNNKSTIRGWAKKMYQDYEINNELDLIKDNNLETNDYEEYIDNNYLIYL
jgi:hypothetical protein